MAEVLDQIETMLVQEATCYRTVDYLSAFSQLSLSHQSLNNNENLTCACSDSQSSSSSSSNHMCSGAGGAGAGHGGFSSSGNNNNNNNNSHHSSSGGITELWREKICEWCYQVIDHFDFSREVVAIAMNYLDRYLATLRTVNKKMFQLVAMTALYLAVKLHEPSTQPKLSMASMIELSRGCYTVNQMVAMELSLIRSLEWHLHPPTAHSFTKRFLHLLVPVLAVSPTTAAAAGTTSATTTTGNSNGIAVDVLYDVLEASRFLAELAVIDYFFVTQRPSDVAVASILNAMQDIPEQAQVDFCHRLEQRFLVDVCSARSSIRDCQARLRLLCALQGSLSSTGIASAAAVAATAVAAGADSGYYSSLQRGQTSPVCVSYGTPIYEATTAAATIIKIEESSTASSSSSSQQTQDLQQQQYQVPNPLLLHTSTSEQQQQQSVGTY